MAATDYNAVVQQLYVSYFGRPADFYGQQNFATQLSTLDTAGALTTTAALSLYVQQNPTSAIAKLVGSFASAPESIALYGTGTDILSISKFVNAIYNNVLHRDADTGGGNFWINEIASGRLSKANAALAITQGALENTTPAGLLDAALVKNTAAAAADFTTSLDSIPKVNAYAGDVAASQARDVLKAVTGTTTATAIHASVVAAIAVLTAPPTINVLLTAGVDALTGTGANDVYNATNAATGSTWTALDSINGGGGTNTLVLVDTVGGVDLSIASISNIQNAVIQSTGAVAGNSADLSGWTGLTSASLSLKSNLVQTVNVAAGTALAVTNNVGVTTTGGSTVSVTAGGAFLAAAKALSTATTLAQATATGGTPAALAASFALQPGVSAADIATVNAAAAAGGAVLADVTNAITAVVNAEIAAFNAAGLASNVSITGNAITAASVTGGNNVIVSDNGKGTLGTVSLNAITGTAGLTGSALTNFNLTGTSTAISVTNATVGHTDTITVNGTKTNTTFADAAAKSVVINSTGAASVVTSLNAGAATSLTVGGDKALTLTGQTAALVTAVTVTGAGGFTGTFTAGVDAATVITATASTGTNNVTIGANQSYLGGSGVDTVTIAANPNAAITGGAGANDVLLVNIGAAFNASANTKISGFETLALGTGTGTFAYDATGFSHLLISNATGAATFSNVAAGVDLAFTAAAGNAITYNLLTPTGLSDVLNVSLKASAANGASNSIIAPGVETINVVTTDSATGTHTAFGSVLTISDAAMTTFKASGSMGLTLTDSTDTLITSVDASGITAGGFSWTTGAVNPTVAALTIKGSAAGGDVINAALVIGKGVTITETAGTNTITGSSTIGSTLTGGTGADTIYGGAGSDVIVGGGGADIISGGAGADLITVSGATAKISQIIGLTASSVGASGANSSTTVQVNELTQSFDVIKGLVAGNTINLGNTGITTTALAGAAGTLTVAGTNLAGITTAGALVNDTAVFASGTYDAGAGTFTYAANGLDSALTYDSTIGAGITMETIILVGYHATVAGTTMGLAGVITL
jgi:hypothetical protein